MTQEESKIIVLDTSLRDGEQAPGAAMTIKQKIEIALGLELLGVDVIDAGFAASSAYDAKGVAEIAKNVKNAIICCLSRARDSDIISAAQSLRFAQSPRIHLFIATSNIHLKHQLHLSGQDILNRIQNSISKARKYVDDVQFGMMDATRTEINFLLKSIEIAINSGAKTINIADTVGYALPDEMSFLIGEILNRVPNIDKATISVHCHNDLGLAVANTLAALKAGARQFEATINGIGERAGNAALEEVIMAINTRHHFYRFTTEVKSEYFASISKLVSKSSGFMVQKNKAIVGENVFLHASGIHQDGIIKYDKIYEIINPDSVGWSGNKIVLSRHSGHTGLKYHLQEMGISLSDTESVKLFVLFKKLASKKKIITQENLLSMIKKIRTVIE